MSRYLPARVRRLVAARPDGTLATAYVITCAEHGLIRSHDTHNGAHRTKAAHNRTPHTPPTPIGGPTLASKRAVRRLMRARGIS